MHRTLKDLSLKDGDALLVLEPESLDSSVFTLNGDVVTVTTPSDCRWLQVEFRPQLKGGEEEKEEERRRVKVPATGNMLPCAPYCLRQVDCTGKLLPPACEELSVRDAGVRLMTTLTLCPGKSPRESQLFLHYTVASAPSAGTEMDIIVEKTCTVKECLKAMLDAIGLDGTCWHLRRLDWCEEVGEPLMDEDAPLSGLKITSGDTLVVTEGLLPPKGFLKLAIWLFVGPRSLGSDFNHTNDTAAEEQTNKGMTAQLPGTTTELRSVGQVEISDEATLEELKTQVLTLPMLQDVCAPTLGFLRVWQMEGWKLTRILRGQQVTLRKLKLTSGSDLCVQQLLKEEDVGPKQVLLNARMAVPGERCYYPPEELLWDASHDSSPRSLRSCVAAHYGLSPDSLLLAKHQPEKHTWEEISNWTQQVSKKKRKKKAESLLGPPFHLKDGDVIGIKNLLIDSNRDFFTAEDEQGQQRLREQGEQRRKGENSATSKSSGKTKPRKPEVPLSISVGAFR
uniref:Ubiquitin specific peptidase 40 n=1 Tax=Iconisemion striatum TaxID=60296 RepID=A0A1A7YQJ0_9TELE